MPFDPESFSYGSWHNPDGTKIILWNYDGSRGIVIGRDQTVRVCTKAPGEYVDQAGRIIAQGFTESEDILFADGTRMTAPNFTPDATGTWFAAGGSSYDYVKKIASESPVLLSAIAEPGRPLDKIELDADPVGLVVTTDRMYLFLHFRNPRSGWPPARKFLCRIYSRHDTTVQVARDESVTIGPPSWRVLFKDFDPATGLALFKAEHDVFGSTWHIYDLEAKRGEPLGKISGEFAAFLDPHLFDKAIEHLGAHRQDQ